MLFHICCIQIFKIHIQVASELLRGLNSVPTLFSACGLWQVFLQRCGLLSLNDVCFSKLSLRSILWDLQKTQIKIIRYNGLFMQIWLYALLRKWLKIIHVEFCMVCFELYPWTGD